MRAAAWVNGHAPSGGDGELAGRSVGQWRTRLARGLRIPGREAALVRKAGATAWPQDGAFNGTESRSGRSLSNSAGGTQQPGALTGLRISRGISQPEQEYKLAGFKQPVFRNRREVFERFTHKQSKASSFVASDRNFHWGNVPV